jgi:TonB family protein
MERIISIHQKRHQGAFLLLLLLFLLSLTSFGQSSVPPEIKKIMFETSRFNNPIWLNLPVESSRAEFQNISQNTDVNEEGIPAARYVTGEKIEDADKCLLRFLVDNNFAVIQSLTQTTHNKYDVNSKKYYFIFYSEDFKRKTELSNEEDFYGNIQSLLRIKAAHRQIVSIDYKNQYEDAPFGMKRKFYSIVFSYKLVNDLPGFQSIEKVFKGKGKAFLDPDDGTWKIDGPFEDLGITLGDKGSEEYMQIIHDDYLPSDLDQIASYIPPPPPPSNEKDQLPDNANEPPSFLKVVVNHDGKILLGLDGLKEDKRAELLNNMSNRYNIKCSPEELNAFGKIESFGVSIFDIKPFLYTVNSDEKARYQSGIPINSRDDQLFYWLLYAWQANSNLTVNIVADKEAPDSIVKKVFITNEKAKPSKVVEKTETNKTLYETEFVIVEEMPEFPGGAEALNSFIAKSIKYPANALKNSIEGNVDVSLIINKDGSVSNVKIIKGIYPSLDAEALRVIKSLPNWKPGKQSGIAVKVRLNIPVTFKMKK